MKRLARSLALAASLAPAVAAAQEAAAPIMAHLASYRSHAAAEKGWHVLADQYSSVLYFRPQFRIVDVDGKGRFFRLYAEGDAALMRLLCGSLTQRKLYCALHDAASLKPVR